MGEGEEGEGGVVTVLDTAELLGTEVGSVTQLDLASARLDTVVAHFLAHTRAVVALQWDAGGR